MNINILIRWWKSAAGTGAPGESFPKRHRAKKSLSNQYSALALPASLFLQLLPHRRCHCSRREKQSSFSLFFNNSCDEHVIFQDNRPPVRARQLEENRKIQIQKSNLIIPRLKMHAKKPRLQNAKSHCEQCSVARSILLTVTPQSIPRITLEHLRGRSGSVAHMSD